MTKITEAPPQGLSRGDASEDDARIQRYVRRTSRSGNDGSGPVEALLGFLKQMERQRERLVASQPSLQPFFKDIYIPAWQVSIPFLPIRCFRDFDLYVPDANEAPLKTFCSSGSTGNVRARHMFSREGIQNYKTHSCEGFLRFLKRFGYSKSTPIISFVPPPDVWPHSSLAAMISMFLEEGFSVHYVDVQEGQDKILSLLSGFSAQEGCLLFGTTFHHLMLMNIDADSFHAEFKKHFLRMNMGIIDTGGTKGRTYALTPAEFLEQLKLYYKNIPFDFLSEYGMCELSSQAWSREKEHDSSFVCNESMYVFSTSIVQQTQLPHHQTGFLGFLDFVNTESWPAIMTEDLGYTVGEREFYLRGRGPDASLKGCSLNVRQDFYFTNHASDVESRRSITSVAKRSQEAILIENICALLKEKFRWNEIELEDLRLTWNGADVEKMEKNKEIYEGQDVLIISAANTPISWMFSFLKAAASGARCITLKAPRLRLDDLFSQDIIDKIEELAAVVSSFFPNTTTWIDSSRAIAQSFENYDVVLAFGSDETMATLSARSGGSKTMFIGHGDIKNSLYVPLGAMSPLEVARLCALWNGRGCLTPLVLFLEDVSTNEKDLQKKWLDAFRDSLGEQFQKRYEKFENAQELSAFVHAHSCWYVQGQFFGKNARIFKDSFTCVVDLLDAYAQGEDDVSSLELGFAGCGFVYVLPARFRGKCGGLQEQDVLRRLE